MITAKVKGEGCNGILTSSNAIKSRKGCGFQIHEVDSADDN